MRLFYVNEVYEVELNKEWILMIPEFAILISRDRGSPGDYRGDKKKKAKRELAFIYYCLDFTSPLREWDEFERRQEALRYTSLTEADIDAEVMVAYDYYEQLLLQSSRSLKTLRSLRLGLDTLDTKFQTIDFAKTDKFGRPIYTTEDFMKNVMALPKLRAAVLDIERAVEEELKADTGIRGKATLGLKEGKKKPDWTEGGPPADDDESRQRVPHAIATHPEEQNV